MNGGHDIDHSLPPELRHVPCARLAPLVEEYLAEGNGLEHLAALCARDCRKGTDQVAWARRIRAIRTLEQQNVEFETADRLLCTMGRVDAWHGELADLYEIPSVLIPLDELDCVCGKPGQFKIAGVRYCGDHADTAAAARRHGRPRPRFNGRVDWRRARRLPAPDRRRLAAMR